MNKILRKHWDEDGTSSKKECSDERKSKDFDTAVTRVHESLLRGGKLVLPNEINSPNQICFRVEDLRGQFLELVRAVILRQVEAGILEHDLGRFIGHDAHINHEHGMHGAALGSDFYLTRLPYNEALDIFQRGLEYIYFTALKAKFKKVKKQAKVARINEEKLRKILERVDQFKSKDAALRFHYEDAAIGPEGRFRQEPPAWTTFLEADIETFNMAYSIFLEFRYGQDKMAMCAHSKLSQEDLNGLLGIA